MARRPGLFPTFFLSGRPAWLKDVMEEAMAAVNRGIDLHGICLFPAVDMPDWHTGGWLHNGICDLEDRAGRLHRVPFGPYVAELRRWQKLLKRVTVLDADPQRSGGTAGRRRCSAMVPVAGGRDWSCVVRPCPACAWR